MLKHNKFILGIITLAICTSVMNLESPIKVNAYTESIQLGAYNVQMDKDQVIKEAIDKNGITWGYQELSDGNIYIAYAKIIQAHMEIPTELNGKTVTAVGGVLYKPADAGPEWRATVKDVNVLQSIKIPATVKVIGNSVGNSVFPFKNLTNVEIPSTTWIGHYAFDVTPWFEKQRDSQGFVIINNILLSAKNQTGDVIIPSNVKEIGADAFKRYDDETNANITSVNIPDNVTKIGENAFDGCSNLKSIILPKGITKISANTFSGCSNLETVTIPNGVKEIGPSAFSGCSKLQNIIIPDSVKEIGGSAFGECISLKKIKIPNNGIHLSSGTFSNCKQLTDIDLPATAVADSNAFDGTAWIEKQRNSNGLIIINNVLMNAGNQKEDFKIPDNVTVIGNHVFSGWTNLKTIKIPTGVTKIGDNAFEECSNLEAIEIPSSVQEIGSYAFISCSKLKVVTLHEGLKTIGMGAFALCNNVKDFKIPSSVTNTYKDSAFDQGITIIKNGTSYVNIPS